MRPQCSSLGPLVAIGLSAIANCRYTDPSLVQLGSRCNSHDSKEQAGSQPPCVGITKALLRRPRRRTVFIGEIHMTRKRIICINKAPTHEEPNSHITAVGIGVEKGWSERLPVNVVIQQLQNPFGDRYYVHGSDGSQADVRLGKCSFCAHAHTFIRTTPDHSLKDNLLQLPECRL